MRENKLHKKDSWFPGIPGTIERFYDTLIYSSDTLTVSENHMEIAMMYFRISTDLVVHKRVVFGFMDWLGALGGIDVILFNMFTFAVGGFL